MTSVIPDSRNRPYSLSFGQQRLWFLHQLDPASSAYNIFRVLRISGNLDLAVFELSLNEIVRRHQILRTTFTSTEEQPVQIVSEKAYLKIKTSNLQHIIPAEREARALELAVEETKKPFDLVNGPLIRVVVFPVDKQEHIVLILVHHIVFDGWSFGVFFRELSSLYEAFVNHGASPLTELSLQFSEFGQEQREKMSEEVLRAQLSYWKSQLNDLPITTLPTDRPRPAIQSSKGAGETLLLHEKLITAIKTLSANEKVTLFMTLLAAFQTLVHRYSSSKDIVVGCPISGRNNIQTEEMIGFFVNTLSFRTDFSGNPTFRQLLNRVRGVAVGAYAHQDLPFEKLVEELRLQRDSSRHPVFQLMCVLQNTPNQDIEIPGLIVHRIDVLTQTAKFDLTLEATHRSEGLFCLMQYNTDLFDATTIRQMLGHFQNLLEGIVENPERKISELPLLKQAEQQKILFAWNETNIPYGPGKLIHRLFEEQVSRNPDSVALAFGKDQLTYRDLNSRANQLAHYLQKLGVKPEVVVGICMERSMEMVIGLLATLKAGGAYVPMDPDYPESRLAFLCEDTDAKVLLTQHKFFSRLPQQRSKIICLDNDAEIIAQEEISNPQEKVLPDNLAYIIYTSGSTGQPKGVMITHKAICNRLMWGISQHGLTENDRILQKASLSFDVSVWECFGALCSGAQLVLLPQRKHQSAAAWADTIAQYQITFCGFTPSALSVFLEEENLEQCNSLRGVICGGEVLSFELQERFHASLSARLFHLYGPTESSIDATHWNCSKGTYQNMIPLGRPIANIRIYLLDSHLQPVPPRVPAELYIGGSGLARGYLDRPDLTAEKFVPDPFSDEPGERLYKTGDLARFLPDGNIEFLGRLDDQVKVRGFRIELGEVEHVLEDHPDVLRAVVLAREDAPGEKRLVAYVTLTNQRTLSSGDLRTFAKERMPDYMVPLQFVMMDAMPLSPSGKVDRRALPPPGRPEDPLARDFVGPRNHVEGLLANVWAMVLGLEQVGVHDNFFDLGGHSLSATRVISRLRNLMQVDLPVRSFFETPTIAELAMIISDNQTPNDHGGES